MQQPPKKKSRAWLWIVLGVVGVLVCSCIGFGVLAGKNTQPTTNTASSSTSASTTAPSSGSQVAKVGQTITVSDVATTLVSVKLLAADQFTKPKSGNEFIVVHVTIVNKSSSEIDYNPFDFHIRSGSGNITNEEIIAPSTYTGNNVLNSGKLSLGGTVEGDIILQVPKGDHKAQLTWQPSFLGMLAKMHGTWDSRPLTSDHCVSI